MYCYGYVWLRGAEIKCAYLRLVFRSLAAGAGFMRVQVFRELPVF